MVLTRQARVAVLNSSPTLIALLQQVLEDEGFATVTARVPEIQRGSEDFLALMTEHDPEVVIYDVCPPYEENWNFLKLLMDTEVVASRRFLITSTNGALVSALAGTAMPIPVVAKPFDLEEVIVRVRQLLQQGRPPGPAV